MSFMWAPASHKPTFYTDPSHGVLLEPGPAPVVQEETGPDALTPRTMQPEKL